MSQYQFSWQPLRWFIYAVLCEFIVDRYIMNRHKYHTKR